MKMIYVLKILSKNETSEKWWRLFLIKLIVSFCCRKESLSK